MKFFRTAKLMFLCLIITLPVYAQETDSTDTEEDFSMYADAELAGGGKRFCTFKVFDQSPNKLISVGYDFQSGYDFTMQNIGTAGTVVARNRMNHGLRLGANVPVISTTAWLVNVGFSDWETHYDFENPEVHPLAQALENTGLRTIGISGTVFKPLNEKNFVLTSFNADLNGDYTLPGFQSAGLTRISGTLVYGWKKHDRLLYGFGISRSYRIGEANYLPVILYNYTFPSRKWGVEAIFPARANLRRTFNPRTIAMFGYELEGQTYRINQLTNNGIANAELRRSELRARITIERSLKDFLWVSLQTGFRYDWNINLDQGDRFRGFGDDAYRLENDLANSFFINFSIN
ncbi:MAG: DUF6268 family outer membrane beta-barrel protein, partial [Cyclobacteriaceae bacterium]|nr:DUF6268 family outer membrane beta-barrel protein [Cyclobacteriaceae bacterium]